MITVDEIRSYSPLAEVQKLNAADLVILEADALSLLETKVGRRLTVDDADSVQLLDGSGFNVLVLPERIDSITEVIMGATTYVENTDFVVRAGGWILIAKTFTTWVKGLANISIEGKWGLDTPEPVKRSLMSVIVKLAVRGEDLETQRNEALPYASANDIGVSFQRGLREDRLDTADGLLGYDVVQRIKPYYRPTIARMI